MLPRSELVSICRDAVDALAQIDHHGIEALPAREGEQLPRQVLAALGGGLDRFERLNDPRLVRLEAALQDLRVAADDHQQVVEIVRDAAGELAERFHFLRLRELLARVLQRGLGLVQFGVARLAQQGFGAPPHRDRRR